MLLICIGLFLQSANIYPVILGNDFRDIFPISRVKVLVLKGSCPETQSVSYTQGDTHHIYIHIVRQCMHCV